MHHAKEYEPPAKLQVFSTVYNQQFKPITELTEFFYKNMAVSYARKLHTELGKNKLHETHNEIITQVVRPKEKHTILAKKLSANSKN